MTARALEAWAELDDGGELPAEHHGGRLVAVANTRPQPVRIVAVVLGEDRCTMLESPRRIVDAFAGRTSAASIAELAAALDAWQPERASVLAGPGRVAWFNLAGWPLIYPASRPATA